MSATHSANTSNSDLIALLSELDELEAIDDPTEVLQEENSEPKKPMLRMTEDLFKDLLPLEESKSEPVITEKESIEALLNGIEEEIVITAPIVEPEKEAAPEAEDLVKQPEEAKEERQEGPKKKEAVKASERKKRFNMEMVPDEYLAELGFERKSFMDGYNSCPVKAMDKVQNVMAWSQGLAELSIYTKISLCHLVNAGTSDTAGFRLAMMSNPEKPYPASTASTQAGQMMSILPVLGMAEKNGKSLTINEKSPLIKKFKSEAM
ncbi:TPA: hypothetical protein ACTYZB_004837 [Klebsiella variicola]